MQSLEADMFGRAKFGIAYALVFVVLGRVPALVCLSHVAQTANHHDCCPHEKPANTAVARCCVNSPAVTSANVNAPAPVMAAVERSVELPQLTVSGESPLNPALDTSPPGCSSILRI